MKKFLCVILVLLLLPVYVSAMAENVYETDTAKVLYSTGIVSEDYSSRLSENVTRCELARIAVEMLGFNQSQIKALSGDASVFTDIHPMSLAGNFVGAANKLGLMNGYGSEFGVNDFVR